MRGGNTECPLMSRVISGNVKNLDSSLQPLRLEENKQTYLHAMADAVQLVRQCPRGRFVNYSDGPHITIEQFDQALACHFPEGLDLLAPCICGYSKWHDDASLCRKAIRRALRLTWVPDLAVDFCAQASPLLCVRKHLFGDSSERMARFLDRSYLNLVYPQETGLYSCLHSIILRKDWRSDVWFAANLRILLQFGCVIIADTAFFPHHAAKARMNFAYLIAQAVRPLRPGTIHCLRLLQEFGQLSALAFPTGIGMSYNLYTDNPAVVEILYEATRGWVVGHCPKGAQLPRGHLREDSASPLMAMLCEEQLSAASTLMRRGAPIREGLIFNADAYRPTLTSSPVADLFRIHYPETTRDLVLSLRNGSPFQRLATTLVLVLASGLERVGPLIAPELIFEILMNVGFDYSNVLSSASPPWEIQ